MSANLGPGVVRPLSVDNTFGWALVAVPIATAIVGVVAGSLVTVAFAIAANWALAVADDKRVQAAGYRGLPPSAWVIMPIYLVIRSRTTGNWAITLAWVFALIVSLLIPVAVAA